MIHGRIASLLAVGVLSAPLMAEGKWFEFGNGLPGTLGVPHLHGSGAIVGGNDVTVTLDNGIPMTNGLMLVGLQASKVPFKQGFIYVYPYDVLLPVATDTSGSWSLTAPWRVGLPEGFRLNLQVLLPDPAAPKGVALSNGLRAATPVPIADAVAWWDGTGVPESDHIACIDLLQNFPAHTAGGCPPSKQVTITPNGFVGDAFHFPERDSPCGPITIDDPVGLPAGDASRTVEFWFRHNHSVPCVGFHLDGASSATKDRFDVTLVSNFTGWLAFVTEGAIFTTKIDTGDSQWHHLATTYEVPVKDGTGAIILHGVLKMYVDGEQALLFADASGALVPWTGEIDLATSSDEGSIGGIGSQVFMRGDLDEVTYYSRALTPTDVKDIYEAGPAGKLKP